MSDKVVNQNVGFLMTRLKWEIDEVGINLFEVLNHLNLNFTGAEQGSCHLMKKHILI